MSIDKGEKTDYLENYKNFELTKCLSLKEESNKKSEKEVVILVSKEKKIDLYPKDKDSIKQVDKYREELYDFEIAKDKFILFSIKVNSEYTAFINAWNISFDSEGYERISLYQVTSSPYGKRSDTIIYEGKEFKRYEKTGNFVSFLTEFRGPNKTLIKLYTVDGREGKILSTNTINASISHPVQLLLMYDNMALIGLHYDYKTTKQRDKIIIVELYKSTEIATANLEIMDVTKIPEEEYLIPIQTTIEIDWEIYGFSIIKTSNKEYIVSINEQNEFKAIDITNMNNRGTSYSVNAAEVLTVKIPDSVVFKAPVRILYDDNSKRIYLHGIDLYSFHFD